MAQVPELGCHYRLIGIMPHPKARQGESVFVSSVDEKKFLVTEKGRSLIRESSWKNYSRSFISAQLEQGRPETKIVKR